MKTTRVSVEAYQRGWPEAFSRIKREVEALLGDSCLRIEHVGSTSVPGMAAKPVIDLDVVIADDAPLSGVIQRLAAGGYIHEGDLGIRGREAFRYDSKPHLMAHHLYVCRVSSEELRRHIAFREYLRTHPEAVREYSRIKQEAAARYPDSIEKYMETKAPCIQRLYSLCGLK